MAFLDEFESSEKSAGKGFLADFEAQEKPEPSLKDRIYKAANGLFKPSSVMDGLDGTAATSASPQARSAFDRVMEDQAAANQAKLQPGTKIVDGLSGIAEVGARKGYAGIGRIEAGAIKALADVLGSDTLSNIASGQQEYANQIENGAILRGTPVEGFSKESIVQDLPDAATSAIGSVIQTVPTLAAGALVPEVALPAIFASATAQEYGQGREAGLNPVGAAIRAPIMGGFEVVGEKLGGMDKIAKGLNAATRGNGVADLASAMVASSLRELPSEEVTTTGQFLTDKLPGVGLNQEAGLAEYGKAVKDTALATLLQSGAMGAGGKMIQKIATGKEPAPQENVEAEPQPQVDTDSILNALSRVKEFSDQQRAQPVQEEVAAHASNPNQVDAQNTQNVDVNSQPSPFMQEFEASEATQDDSKAIEPDVTGVATGNIGAEPDNGTGSAGNQLLVQPAESDIPAEAAPSSPGNPPVPVASKPDRALKPRKAAKANTLLNAIKSLGGIKNSTKSDVVRDKFARGGYNQVFTNKSTMSIESLVGSGELDDYLPHEMRYSTKDDPNGEVPDMQDAIEWVKEKIANGERVIPYDAQLELDNKQLEAEHLYDEIASQLSEDEINELFRIATNEENEATGSLEFSDTENTDGSAERSDREEAGAASQPAIEQPQTSQEQPAQQVAPPKQEREGVRPLVESLVKRRAAANEMGKGRVFDNALAAAKSLLSGEEVKPAKFKNAAKTLAGDKAMQRALMALHDIAKQPGPEPVKNGVESTQDHSIDAVITQDQVEPLLTTQSPQDLESRVKALEQQRNDEAEAKRKQEADAQREEFTLTGSDRSADEAAARGAQDLFADAGNMVSKSMAPAPFNPKLAVSEPKAEYAAYETDIFGNELPIPQRRTAAPAAVPRDIHATSSVSDTPGSEGEYFVNTVVGTEQERTLGASAINNAADAAAATQYLYKSAVERFDAIVTDKDGKPLAVVGGFKGALMQTAVYPAVVAAEAVRVPGAAKIWFSHNHPSGTHNLSRADSNLYTQMHDVFRGSGIEPQGLLAVTGNKYSAQIDPDGHGIEQGDIPASRAQVKVPVVSRELNDSRTTKLEISGPDSAKRLAKDFYSSRGENGILLLDAQNAVVAWVPVSPILADRLRDTGGLNTLYRAISQANAAAAIVVQDGGLDAELTGNVSIAENIGAALKRIDVKPLDIINVKTGESYAEKGRDTNRGPLFSRSDSESSMSVDQLKAILDPIEKAHPNLPGVIVVESQAEIPEIKAKIDSALEQYRENESPENLVKLSQLLKDDVEGAYVNGKIYIVASNISDAKRLREVYAHEGIGHYSMEAMLNEVQPKLFDRIVNRVVALDKEGNTYIRKLAEIVDSRQPELNESTRAKEIIALIAERGDQDKDITPGVRSILQRIVDGIKAFAKLVFDTELSDQDVRDIVSMAGRYARGEKTESIIAGSNEVLYQRLNRKPSRESGDTFVTAALEYLARDPEFFQRPSTEAKDIYSIAKELDPGYRVERVGPSMTKDKGANRAWEVFVPGSDVRSGIIMTKEDEVWIDVSRLQAGQDSGSAIYDMAAAYAHNNGKVLIGDPLGLSRTAYYRRNENMLSSALKYGTTRHLRPHLAQEVPDEYYTGHEKAFGESVRPLNWIEGDDVNNIKELVYNSWQSAIDKIPDLKNVIYEPATGQFTKLDGTRVDDDYFKRNLAELLRTPSNPYRAGSATQKRAALFNTFLRSEGRERGRPLLDSLVNQLSRDGLAPALRDVMYSRSGSSSPSSQENKSENNWLIRRDGQGRMQFAPTGKVYDVASEVIKKGADAINFGYAPPELRKLIRKMKADVQNAIELSSDVAKNMKGMSDMDRRMISDVIEKMLKTGVTPPEHVLKVASSMQQIMDVQTDDLVALGMLSEDAANRWRGQYLPRFYKREQDPALEGMNALMRAFRTAKPIRGLGGGSLKGRGLYEEVPANEVDQWEALGWQVRDPLWKKNQQGKLELVDTNKALPDAEKVMVWRDFTPEERERMGENRDSLYRFVMGYTAMQKDIALGRLFDSIAKNTEFVRSRASEGYTKVPDSVIPETGGVNRYGNLAGLYVRDDIMAHISQYEESSDLLKAYRKALSFWKAGKTVLNPVAHVNNVVSNLTMAHFAGVSYWDSHKYVGALRDLYKNTDMVKEAKDVGLFSGDLSREEFLSEMPDDIKAMMNQQDSTLKKGSRIAYNIATMWLTKPLGKAYRAEDDFFKYLIYRDARANGMEPADAVDYATQYIFNYDDLPKSARIVRDTAIPFFAYTYKAVPALAHTAANYPWRFVAPAALIAGVNAIAYSLIAGDDDDDLLESLAKGRVLEEKERKNLPPWMQGKSSLGTEKAVRLGADAKTGLPIYWDISRFIPGGDLFDVTNQAEGLPLPAPIMPSNPVLTSVAALIWNKDTFTGKDITDKNDTPKEAAKKRGEWVLKMISPAIAPTGYHADKLMQATANGFGEPIETPFKDYTGKGKDGLPVQPKYAAMQTFGIKARPVDLETSADISRGQDASEVRSIRSEIMQAKRMLNRGAISAREFERTREEGKAKIKQIRSTE